MTCLGAQIKLNYILFIFHISSGGYLRLLKLGVSLSRIHSRVWIRTFSKQAVHEIQYVLQFLLLVIVATLLYYGTRRPSEYVLAPSCVPQ